MKRVYIAGPMRSKPEFNFPAFFEAERKLREAADEAGIPLVIQNPARMDVEAESVNTTLTRKEQEAHAGDPANARRYAWRDLAIIVHKLRAEDEDAVVVLPDWEESTGATAEVAVARWVRVRVLPLEEALLELDILADARRGARELDELPPALEGVTEEELDDAISGAGQEPDGEEEE